MKVSVIVPVYNVEKYLDKCLNSLVNQTLKDIEIIVVNDGSLDNSQKIINQYAKKYPKKIKAYIKKNGGLSSARNFGLQYTSGDYICFVDSDDWLDIEALEKMYEKACEENSDIVICDMVDHFDSDNSIKYLNCTKFDSIYNVTASACNKIFKKSFIGELRFLDGIWYEDLNFTTKLLLKNPRVSVISKGYYNCHVRAESIMNNNNSEKNLDIIKSIEDLKKYSFDNGIYDENIFYLIIFNHILITAINRVTRQKGKNSKIVIKKLRNYCRKNILKYKNKPFYSNISWSRRVIAGLNYNGLHVISNIILNIKSKMRK